MQVVHDFVDSQPRVGNEQLLWFANPFEIVLALFNPLRHQQKYLYETYLFVTESVPPDSKDICRFAIGCVVLDWKVRKHPYIQTLLVNTSDKSIILYTFMNLMSIYMSKVTLKSISGANIKFVNKAVITSKTRLVKDTPS